MRAHGKVNLIAVLILGAVVGGIWWLGSYSGVYLDNLEVKDKVTSAFNSWGIKNEDSIRRMLLMQLNDKHLGKHRETNDFGEEVEVGGLGITDEQLTIEADDVNRQLTVRLEYDREVKPLLLKSTKRVHFVVEKTGPFPR